MKDNDCEGAYILALFSSFLLLVIMFWLIMLIPAQRLEAIRLLCIRRTASVAPITLRDFINMSTFTS